MAQRRNFLSLWLLLLFDVSGSAVKFSIFSPGIAEFTAKPPEAQEGAMRLSGSERPWEGRVEVYHNDRWGTVCDDGWDMAEAQVVCRQLNFPGAKSVVVGKNYRQASGPIWLDDVKCDGTEMSLFACRTENWGVTDCTHKEDVGVICEPPNTNVTVWNFTHNLDHSISLSDDLGALLDSGRGCDFLIVFESAAGNKGDNDTLETTICTHKAILSQFRVFNMPAGITINVSLACQPYVTSFVRYLYTRKMDVTVSSAQCLHQLASEFKLKRLMGDIGRLFTQILPDDSSFQTQLSLLQYATQTEDIILWENCMQYLAWNFQKLTQSPAWLNLSWEVLGALLSRSDLVVPDEYFVLKTVESLIQEKGNRSTSEAQVKLLNSVRFPMIPAEELYELEVNSSLYDIHKNVYQEMMLKALQFNVLLFNKLAAHPKFSQDDHYQPRIYTAEPWGVVINATNSAGKPRESDQNSHRTGSPYFDMYGNLMDRYHKPAQYEETLSERFSTRRHGSMLFKDDTVDWVAKVFKTQSECSDQLTTCESFPAAMLVHQGFTHRENIIYRNQLLVICQDKYVCQVQEFKNSMAYIAVNGTKVPTYPCPSEKYIYHFVVRPEYI
ncbi:galectin-3-binding protein A-like isoform X1 [Phycodurus eques]|uniref:galectin-3-binding protein A-like isoform X1 n=1 Tax=Phycodurus eques TaxID=693459 RepID=UPI002ACEC00B|nr:galectin-3-binding protein A-like isoform X1 [Phycodurus eques]